MSNLENNNISNCYLDEVLSILDYDPYFNDVLYLFSKGGSIMDKEGRYKQGSKFLLITYGAKVENSMAIRLGIKHKLSLDNRVTEGFIAIPLIQLPQDIEYRLYDDYSHIFLDED